MAPTQEPSPTTPPPTPTPMAMTAVQIAEMAEKSIFRIDVYDKLNNVMGVGSGFFIDEQGSAVVNYHILDRGYRATVTLSDGTTQEVALLRGYDRAQDLAVIKVEGEVFTPLEIGSSDGVKVGQTIFGVISPLDFDNTIIQGKASAVDVAIEEAAFMQMEADLDSGSGGGAALDDLGKVIGIFTDKNKEDKYRGLIIPSKLFDQVDLSGEQTLQHIYDSKMSYSENITMPDFGVYFDIAGTLQKSTEVLQGNMPALYISYAYHTGEGKWKEYADQYEEILADWGFKCVSRSKRPAGGEYRFSKEHESISVEEKGKNIVITFTRQIVPLEGTERYYSNSRNIPDYGYFTGSKLLRKEVYEHETIYVYHFNSHYFYRYGQVATQTEGFAKSGGTFKKRGANFSYTYYNTGESVWLKPEVAIIVPNAVFVDVF